MKRYGNIDYLMNMCAYQGLNQIMIAFKNNNKDELYLYYLHSLPNMTKENYISFKDFYNSVCGVKNISSKNIINESKEDVLKKVESILTKFEGSD